jgi:hypothetical protein
MELPGRRLGSRGICTYRYTGTTHSKSRNGRKAYLKSSRNIVSNYGMPLDEPVVGILYSWENEAMLGRLSLGAYQLPTPVYEYQPRPLDAPVSFRRTYRHFKGTDEPQQVPYEYVTDRDINAGLAARYPVIYLPYVLALDEAIPSKASKNMLKPAEDWWQISRC